ncbi:Small subunit processome component [Dirofilaria immitis]
MEENHLDLLSEILRASFEIKENDVQNVAIQILVSTMCHCSIYTSKEYSALLVDVILEEYKSATVSFNIMKSAALAKLLNAWVSQKMGKSLHKPSSLFQVIIDGAKSRAGEVDTETLELLRIAIKRYHGDSELHTLITTAVRMLTNDNQKYGFDVILDFFCEISDIPLFDIWIMPIVGTFMSRLVIQEDAQIIRKIFRFYANICSIRRPIWKSKGERNCFFDISHHLEVRNKLIDILKAADKFDTEILEIAAVFNILVRSMSCLDSIDARLSLLSANACFLFDPSLFSQFTLDTLLKYYKNMGNNEAALRTLVLMLPFVEDREKLKNISAMSKVANEILPMFGHWSSYVRQVALEILVHFKIPVNNKRSNDGTTIEVESAFNLLLHSERIPWTLEEYRTRLMILRQLTYGAHTKHMPKGFDTIIETIPLRVIIGNLYEPFTIAWNELKNIIQDYAYGLNIDTFFSLFLSFIDQVELKNQRVLCENSDISNDCDILDKMTIIADKNPQNYGAFRLEMFGILSRISDLCERRTKLLSPLFIHFFRNEYQHGNLLERRENILSISTLICTINKDEEKDGPNDDSPEIIGKSDDDEVIVEDKYVERKLIRNSLIALLELFANFTSPKIIFMANEIRDLYDELLMVADEGVQQRALNCIFTYNYKYLTPYREYLESLVQDRTLINGLMKFSIDDHNSVVDSSHRASVMPIVLRLLYGKCNVHCKKDMTERRAAIFRFLAGSTSNELDFFLRMLFAPLLKIIGEDKQSLEIFCKQTVSTFDASSMVPLQIIKGFALFS